MGRPKKNALVELKPEQKQENAQETSDSEVVGVVDVTKSLEDSVLLLKQVAELSQKVESLEAQLAEKDEEIVKLRQKSKVTLSKETVLKLKEILGNSVRRSNNVTWRKEGKALIEELDKAL